MIIILYSLFLFLTTIYSYALVDPNLTFVSHHLWVAFRELIIPLGYYHRELSSWIYAILVALLFLFHLNFTRNFKKLSILHILFPVSIICLFSYPFLSHDFFNYIFDARILTVYGENPYVHKALDFPQDQWLRFMHWTHRTYPYGPTWLLITLIPSFLALGKFILNFFLFKLFFILFFTAAVLYLNKLNKKWAIFFATNPLVIIEGLVNAHNDLIAVVFGIIGIFYLVSDKDNMPFSLGKWLNSENKSYYTGLLHFLFSAGIKYTTLPILALLSTKYTPRVAKWIPAGWRDRQWNFFIFLSIIGILIYLSLTFEIQPWYFLNLFIFLPFYGELIQKFNIFFVGLLLSYYPYIRFGGWDKSANIELKHWIIIVFFLLNLAVLAFQYVKKPSNYNPS